MAKTMASTAWAAALLGLGLLHVAAAQDVVPANTTSMGTDEIAVQIMHSGDIVDHWPVRPLQNGTVQPDDGLRGNITLVDSAHAADSYEIKTGNVVILSCDQYAGNIQAAAGLELAIERNASAIILYSTDNGACELTGASSSYDRIYTTNSQMDSRDMSSAANANNAEAWVARSDVLANAAATESHGSNGNGNGSDEQTSTTSWGPSPSTAVAMIILYSITGIITALFLVIIITGAVRAHRHPERYGPRNIIGRPRQSRARGLARAMLETLPIVRFGESHEEGRNKPTDVELAEGQHGPVEMVSEQGAPRSTENSDPQTAPAAATAGGIAAATERSNSTPPQENLGCSICTEDFERGEDVRVLPCDHRYHPGCIDPWLLNVSGTCPLCRIDLRPQAEEELDEAGNPITREGDAMAPPLDGDYQRQSIRRSIMIGLTGIGRPERLTREERVAAIRRYTEQQRAAASSQDGAENGTGEMVEEESSMRRRLRNAFRVRTRRAGENGQDQDVVETTTTSGGENETTARDGTAPRAQS